MTDAAPGGPDGPEPIGVIGAGWVGLVTAACFAELGHSVVARDVVEEKVEALNRGEVTIHEPGLAELLTGNSDRLEFTTDMDRLLGHARLLFVCVDTPPTHSGDADLSRVRAVVDDLAGGSDHILIMKSTVPRAATARVAATSPAASRAGPSAAAQPIATGKAPATAPMCRLRRKACAPCSPVAR